MKIRKDLLLIHIILVTLIVTVWGIWILKQRADLKSIEKEIRHREQLQKASESPNLRL